MIQSQRQGEDTSRDEPRRQARGEVRGVRDRQASQVDQRRQHAPDRRVEAHRALDVLIERRQLQRPELLPPP